MSTNKYLNLLASILIFMLLVRSLRTEAAPHEDSLITYLPGFNGTFLSSHYSGYISLDQKSLFYYFVVSERNPSKDPVVLWLNGGPGCSSLGGFVYEHGPFNFVGQPNGNLPILHNNPFSWSKVSNIIYLDSPCGVGLSYSKNESNYVTGDLQTAADTHSFLLEWFEMYPEFVDNPFYISGESYAGIYVPTLAAEVVKGIKAGALPLINFKGYMIGNGIVNTDLEGISALVPFTHGMGLISDDIFEEIQSGCKGNYSDPSDSCQKGLGKFDSAIAGLNIYDILEPCYNGEPATKQDARTSTSFTDLAGATKRSRKNREGKFGHDWLRWFLDGKSTVPFLGSVPCFDDVVATAWLNDDSVRKAIHAEPKSSTGPWELCTDRLSYESDAGSMIPYHRNLTTQGYGALIYSGDHDMRVPFTGTQVWTRSMGYNVVDSWRPWMSNDQVAGYLQGYEFNLTFLTIKGAGHMVPLSKPQESLDFYMRWLNGQPI